MSSGYGSSVSASTVDRKQLARRRLTALERIMDSAIDVPMLRTTVGLDALLGVIPVAGDLASAAIGLFMINEARELGASRWLQAKMLRNLLVDAAVGSVPLAGDLFDVYFRAHRRNLKLLQKELGEPYLEASTERAVRRR